MLRLRGCILAHLRPSPATYLHRLLSAAAAAAAADPTPAFTVEQYLVETCGLSRAQALKASTKLPYLKPPTNPDAVLAFLAGLGLSSAEVAALVAKDPKFLYAGVERTLTPVLVGLTGLGLSPTEIAHLVSLVPVSFRCRSVVSNLPYYLSLFGSYESLVPVLRHNSTLLGSSLEKVVKPNVALLRECGVGGCGISKLCVAAPWILGMKPESLRATVARAEALGVPRGSVMFRHALQAVRYLSEEMIVARVEHLKSTFTWSDAEVGVAVSKFPQMLIRSQDNLQSRSKFLISEVGLEPAYIAHHPALLSYGLEGRLRPRYYVLKFLKENRLLDRDRKISYYSAVSATEKAFMEKYIIPHGEAAPHLAEDYATACAGEVPTSFRFALTKDRL